MQQLMTLMNFELFHIGENGVSLGDLVLAFAVLVAGIWISRRIRLLLRLRICPRFHIPPSTSFAIATMAYYIGVAATLVITLSLVGFDLQNLAIVVGALSVGIGMGLQTIANNFVSGLLLLFDRSIKVGDFVELADGTFGIVEQIRVRSTIIRSNDGNDIIVPNSLFLSDQVINWTLTDDARRLHVPFGVAYGSDVDRLFDVILDLAGRLPDVETGEEGRRPLLWFTAMGDSSLDFELLVWVKKPAVFNPRTTISGYLREIHRTLIANGFQIPFPQRDIHVKSMPAPDASGR